LRSRENVDTVIMDAMIARIDVLNAKVEDILRFARPRSPMIEPVDLRAVLADAVASARAGAGRDCPEILAELPAVALRADREMLRDVLLNLLLNACQSGTREPVQVTVQAYAAVCRIEIADRGSGIGEADSARVFDAFYTTKKSGTGLGLAIVHRLVTMQDGAIALLPRDGGGTIARLELPLAASAGPARGEPRQAVLNG
jgi:signal transduction histidine kinase